MLSRYLRFLLVSTILMHTPSAFANAPTKVLSLQRGAVRLEYDLGAGTASLAWDGVPRLTGFHSAVKIGGRTISSTDYAKRRVSTRRGEAVVTLTGEGLPTMRQHFTLEAGRRAIVRVEVDGQNLASNWMAPIVAEGAGSVDIGAASDARALKVPFDNDRYARYDAAPLEGAGATGTSYEAAAFYDNDSRHGLVVGSVTHDTWKTGITFTGAGGHLSALSVFGGAADEQTRDVMPHGTITGDRLLSPKVMAGYYADWRDGLEDFAAANAKEVPPLKWAGGVPFGWNSWGKIQQRLNYATAIAISDAFARELPSFKDRGTAYINLDSWWDNLSEAELRNFVLHARANGQKAGIYWTPFAYWLHDLNRKVEGSSYTYGDIVLRDKDGTPIVLNGGIALDPTHPGTKRRIDVVIDRFKRIGFEYIKLDFMNNGAVEGGSKNGTHYDPKIQTGIQAYNDGMAYLLRRIGRKMFVSLSIAPIFPYQYAHARRVACDTFGAIRETAYEMNSATCGWWLSGRLYAYNDPDHMVLEDYTPNENQSRVTSAAVTGTVFLNGDDLTHPLALKRAQTYLTNEAVNGVARLGRAFRPVEGNTGSDPADLLALKDGNTFYLAAFNFDGKTPATKHVGLARAGLDGAAASTVTDLWTGRTWTARGTITLDLAPAQSTILKINKSS